MKQGVIWKALSGFYDVKGEGGMVRCRAPGKFRHRGQTPLVGDWVTYTQLSEAVGVLEALLPRRNQFERPAVANMDQMVIVASAALPVTDPFLIDRVIAIAERAECQPVLCVNKWDLEPGQQLLDLYGAAGFPAFAVSAKTGLGLEALARALAGKASVFTGNSGVGKSSLLNALGSGLCLPVGEVSVKLGRGRHTTRHIELFSLPGEAVAADTPGFSAFDPLRAGLGQKEELASAFREFLPYLPLCRYTGCSHVAEQGCAVLAAVRAGQIAPSRHASYVRLYRQAGERHDWEQRE